MGKNRKNTLKLVFYREVIIIFEELVRQVSGDMQAKQDEWVLNTLRKNGIYISDDYTHADLYFACQLHDVKFERNQTSIDFYIGGVCKGKWFTEYKPKFDNLTYTIEAKCWN
jgi:hypothetical protein